MVSYVSKVFESSPYVAPLSLDVLSKVLAVKQTGFDEHAEEIQSKLDSIAALDIAKGVDRDYVNQKLNSIVDNTNKLGGVDLSDVNISNQISGYASSIYQDDNVINAVAGTKAVRSWQASREKFMTDPKLIKYYDEANDSWDQEKIDDWMGDQTVGKAYNGPTSLTRYTDYVGSLSKALKDVQAREQIHQSVEGFWVNESKTKILSPDDVMKMARDLMGTQERDQMMRSGRYLYHKQLGLGEQDLVGKAVAGTENELAKRKAELIDMQLSAGLEGPNKSMLNAKAEELKNYVAKLEQAVPAARQAYSNLYRSNPNELMYKVFSDDVMRGLGEKFAIYKTDAKLTPNAVAINNYNQKMKWAEQTRDLKAAEKINQDRLTNATQLKWMELAAKGDAYFDELTQSWKYTGINGGAGGAGGGAVAAGEMSVDGKTLKDMSTDELDGFRDINTQQIQEINKTELAAKGNYLAQILSKDHALKGIVNDLQYDYNKDGVVTLDDFQQQVVPDEANPGKYRQTTKDETSGFWPTQFLPAAANTLVSKALAAVEAASTGKLSTITNPPPGTAELAEQLNLLQAHRAALQNQNDQYAAGNPIFNISQFGYRSVDESKLNKATGTVVKNYIKLNKDYNITSNPDDIHIVGVGPAAGGKGFEVVVDVDSSQKNTQPNRYKVPISAAVASMLNVEDGPYSELNGAVDTHNDFYGYAENKYDRTFKSKIRVFQYGNGKTYKFQYMMTNPATGYDEAKDVPLSLNGGQDVSYSSPAKAYARAKEIIENFGARAKVRANLRKPFEQIINSP